MATIEMKDASGKKVKDAELSAAVFEIEPNVHVMHEVFAPSALQGAREPTTP